MIAEDQRTLLHQEHTSTLSHITFIIVLEIAVAFHRLRDRLTAR